MADEKRKEVLELLPKDCSPGKIFETNLIKVYFGGISWKYRMEN